MPEPRAEGGRHERTFVAMGTRMRFVAYGDRAPVALGRAEDLVRRIEAQLSRFRPDSDIAALVRGAGGWVPVRPHTDAALRAALHLARLTDGLCDPVLGVLVDLWGPSRRGEAGPPDDEAVHRALARCGHTLLERGPGAVPRYRVACGARVDLGALGKGYAAHQAAGLLRRLGVTSALVACGASSVAAVGGRPDGAPWRVGLRAPLDAPLRTAAAVPIADEHLSVSGDDDAMHVLDPRTGRPVAGDLRSAAVVAPDGTLAEALSTAVLVAGSSATPALCRRAARSLPGSPVRLPGRAPAMSPGGAVDAVLVRADGRVVATPGVRVATRPAGWGGVASPSALPAGMLAR